MQQAALNDEHLKLIQALRDGGVQVEYEHQSATATGLGFSGSGDQAASLNYGVTGVDGSGGASVGAGGIGWEAVSPEAGIPVLLVLGGLAVLGGAGLAIFRQPRAGLMLAAAGGLLIALSVLVTDYPWVLAVAGVLVLGVLGWLVYRLVTAGNEHRALSAVTKAVETSPAGVADEVKRRVADLGGATPAIKAAIRKAKAGA